MQGATSSNVETLKGLTAEQILLSTEIVSMGVYPCPGMDCLWKGNCCTDLEYPCGDPEDVSRRPNAPRRTL